MTQFFIAFSTGCILIGALYILCPEGNLSKPVKHLFSLVFIVIILSAAKIPLKSVDYTPAKIDITQNQSYNDIQLYSAEYVFTQALKSQNIEFDKISFFTDKTATDSIVITKVVIVSSHPKEKILSALEGLLENREVEIINEQHSN